MSTDVKHVEAAAKLPNVLSTSDFTNSSIEDIKRVHTVPIFTNKCLCAEIILRLFHSVFLWKRCLFRSRVNSKTALFPLLID